MIKSPKDTKDLSKKGSFISLPLPLTAKEIHRQLFEVITRFKFEDEDEIYLSFKSDQNFTLYFNNHGFIGGTTYIYSYLYSDFTDKDSVKFSQEIFEEIEKLRKEE